MDSSAGIGTNHQPGAQNEPFFDLLQPSVPSSSNSTKNMENNSGEYDFRGGDNVLPSFDFQPIRPSGGPSPKTNNPVAGRTEEGRGRQSSPPRSFTYEPMVRRSSPTYDAPVSRPHELEKESLETATVAAVERTMKKYADNLLRVLEGLTARLSQLESTAQRLEHFYGEIRNVVVNNHGEIDGKLRSLENHVLEVQRGVQLLRDRQELAETQSRLASLQAVTKSEIAAQSGAPSAPPPVPEQLPELKRVPSGKMLLENSQQQITNMASSAPYQQPQGQLPSVPPHSPPQPLPQQQPLAPQQQQQQPQQASEVSHQTLHMQPPPPPQQITHPQHPQHPPPPPPPSQMSMQPFYPQQQPPQPQAPPPPVPAYGHQAEAPAYGQHPQGPHHVPPPQSYSPDLSSYHPSSYGPPGPLPQPARQTSQVPPSSHIQPPHSVYDPSLSRSGSGQLALPPPYPLPAQQVSIPPVYDAQSPGSGYPSSYRVAQPVPSAPTSGGGGGGYPRFPVAQPLPHALPAGGSVNSGSSSLSANRVPIDDVIDKVTQMGFSKDQVRAVVRRLTENGQSVDLNIVLDKLMNGGDGQPPPKGWFGR